MSLRPESLGTVGWIGISLIIGYSSLWTVGRARNMLTNDRIGRLIITSIPVE